MSVDLLTAPEPTMLAAFPPSMDECPLALPVLSKLAVLRTVIRRSGPHLIEATIIPGVLFYACLVFAGLPVAFVAAVGWTYAAVGRRLWRREPVPPILLIGVIGITVHTLVAILSGSSFLYFVQPVLGTVVMGCVFLASVAMGKPLIGKLAGEFWAISPEDALRPGVIRLFRRLTLLWAAVNMVTAALTMTLLMWLPLTTFVAMKQISGLAITGGAVFLTVSLSLSTARSEGLVSAAPTRRLVATTT